jgi:hypothetical protein
MRPRKRPGSTATGLSGLGYDSCGGRSSPARGHEDIGVQPLPYSLVVSEPEFTGCLGEIGMIHEGCGMKAAKSFHDKLDLRCRFREDGKYTHYE